jgi:cardiolipin synthase A/B
MVRRLVIVGLLVALGTCSAPQAPSPQPPPEIASGLAPLVDPELQLLVTPAADHQPFVAAIDAARTSIDMTMFHLTDRAVVEALAAAVARGVQVRVIVDGKGVAAKANRAAYARLEAGGIQAHESSPAFAITHAKAMVVDGGTTFITAINLTQDVARTRDLGIITHDRGIAADVEAIFAADWHNAETRGHETPRPHAPSLVVAPVNARAQLHALIASARHELLVTVENLGDPDIEAALAAAVAHGVTVRIIVPLCDKNPNPLYNLPAAHHLVAAGAAVRMMPAPESAEQPYMHSKLILADATTAYVGSVNFSANSISHARELGVLFAQPAAASQILALFETDWTHAIAPPADGAGLCR